MANRVPRLPDEFFRPRIQRFLEPYRRSASALDPDQFSGKADLSPFEEYLVEASWPLRGFLVVHDFTRSAAPELQPLPSVYARSPEFASGLLSLLQSESRKQPSRMEEAYRLHFAEDDAYALAHLVSGGQPVAEIEIPWKLRIPAREASNAHSWVKLAGKEIKRRSAIFRRWDKIYSAWGECSRRQLSNIW